MKVSLKNKIFFNLFNSYKNIQKDLHELSYLFWECTLRCNLNCLHCGSDCKKTSNTKDMPLKDFLNVLLDVKKEYNPHKTIIVLTGGEPLLRDDLEECGAEFYKNEFPWGMVTNGLAMTEKRFVKLLESGLRSITISLDGLKESHNWLRNNPNSYKKASEAIYFASNTKNLVYDVVTCVNQKNFNELPYIKEELIKLGVKNWRLFTIFPKGRAADNQLLDLKNEQFRELMDFIVKTRNEKVIKASFSCEGFVGNYEAKVRDGIFFCRAGINIGSVLADGSISACPSLRGDYIQGNIYKDNFIDVWKNKFNIMRDRKWAHTGICADCDCFKWCEGNGLHLRDEKTGELLKCHLKMLED
ncbi:MAG: radical SAM/SPASM domain-containing protein [Spirochaetes bacterium GWD1_27_9]|nr:MAG: radical SAM/SPASM domain-containing protein [Spirochaetes bacterium GWB1_27_13]OHD25376.1 MAG: radical SAM/SPASM domain-containing protein [Spirochaetes bacterium GWC1_27_15]OHD30304.1 MAG: radical SAM/SPASM domain-containing protein [Spirochaetes bacterium GWD1_27_9]